MQRYFLYTAYTARRKKVTGREVSSGEHVSRIRLATMAEVNGWLIEQRLTKLPGWNAHEYTGGVTMIAYGLKPEKGDTNAYI